MRIRGRARRSDAHRALLAVVALLLLGCGACAGGGFFRQYEYEEEMYLALDGSATMYVNSSLAALNALRGTTFDAGASRVDRDAVREYFSGPGVHVERVSTSRRSGRPFVHVRLAVDDVRRLSEGAPFAWSVYRFDRRGDQFVYEQQVGAPANAPRDVEDMADVGGRRWTGKEQVAFRVHMPSKIEFHNTKREGRGGILEWEQPLADRLHGEPLRLEARIQTESILARTLLLFGATFVAVAIGFAATIWWVMRRGRLAEHPLGQAAARAQDNVPQP